MKKKILLGICLFLMLGFLFRPQLVEMKDQLEVTLYHPLSGVQIILDAGHGEPDGGARDGEASEQKINLAIVKYTKQLLEEAGAKVILTRKGSNDLASDGVSNRKRDDMKKRVLMINDRDVDLFISVHLNAFPNPSIRGTQVFYRKGDLGGKDLALLIQENFKSITKAKMIPKSGDFYILNNTNKLGVLVECGFLSNGIDKAQLIQKEYQKKVAKVLYKSVKEYFQALSN